MALSNGYTETQKRPVSPTQHLGKRKRTPSTEPESEAMSRAKPTMQNLQDAFQLIQQHSPPMTILRYPLSSRRQHEHALKKQRTETPDHESNNIESRISNDEYESLDDLLDDLRQIRTQIEEEESETNVAIKLQPPISRQITILLDELSRCHPKTTEQHSSTSPTVNGDTSRKNNAPFSPSSQVLSLRSQTEHGIRQLFSGLPQASISFNSNGRKLPNGFELTEVVNVDINNLHGKDGRKFGDVFASPRNTKTLEMPRVNRPSRGNTLNFIKPFENVPNPGKTDFKFANLNTGLWLRYGVVEKSIDETKDRKLDGVGRAGALFKAAFSSFAPSTDDSQSVVTAFDKSQQWWKSCTISAATEKVFATTSQSNLVSQIDQIADVSDNDLEEMVANYIADDDETTEINKLLDEVSELIETLTSYQALRSLEVARGPSSASKPSKDEQSTYEMLRNQLQLLVSSLPPFAVAKLNGDQLDELNITTHILVEPPEFVGTAQLDEYTMRRNRAAQVATSAAARNPTPTQTRAAYSTPASAYNAQARAYNSVSNSTYTARPPNVVYNTPRPTTNTPSGAYPPSQYRPNGPAIHTPSIQQFQRPMTNGYGSATTPAAHSPFVQRPSQPGYQQRAQDSITYGRVEASQKAVVNGDMPQHQPRQYSATNANTSGNVSNTMGAQQLMTESIKQRQPSGTPQPHTAVVDGIGTTSS